MPSQHFCFLPFQKYYICAFTLLYFFHINNNFGGPRKCVFPTVECYTQVHSIYAAVATCVLVLFIVSPTIFLILYPTRLFRKCVSCWGFRRWHALQMIVESFQGQYKDGTNGNHDFRMVSASFLILRIVILASFLNRHTYIWSSSGQCLLLAGVTCFYGITRPYKLSFMDSIDIVILFLLEVLSVVASNPSPNHFVYAILLSLLLLGVPHMVLI